MSDAQGPERKPERLPPELEDEVLAALERDDATRDTVLANILEREPAHADGIRRWLREAGALPGDEEATSVRVGPWRVLRLLGRGGFGAVYLAESDSGAQAAVKVLNDGVNSREVLRRFAAEREALLRLDHVGIARLLDAGETENGRPWFAMEYVAGSSLLVYCRRARLSRQRRLGLFLRVLDAVAHAHQRGILHRDLSANNVLVADERDDPHPKIIDFGIAKSLHGAPLGDGPMTLQATVMGTPEYMSPEQAVGEPGSVDTRADVYSLGAQLYELLTDRLPVPSEALRAQGPLGIAEALQHHDPEPPSAVAPASLRRGLRGDLDSIVMRAIAKEREERYPSAAEFASDLRRHLANEPVLAARSNAWYVLRKYARRHRAGFALVTIAALAVLALLSALFVDVARRQQDEAAEAHLARERAALDQRAESVLRLLVARSAMQTATEEERALSHAWPAREGDLRAWLEKHAEPMRASLRELQSQRERMLRHTTSRDREFAAALDRIRDEIESFLSTSGCVGRIERRLRFAETCEVALERDEIAWREAGREIRATRGFELAAQTGLTPLGKNPDTGLLEFLDLATHGDQPVPQRGPDGRLEAQPGIGIVFAWIPRAPARLGSQRDAPGVERFDPDAEDDELRGGRVTLDDYLVARTELTRAQWARLVDRPCEGDPDHPQTDVSWNECVAALRAHGMDLPTEAQWEHACRAGTATPWWPGSSRTLLADVAAPGPSLQRVAQARANAFGLHDVHGNAAEWCKDRWLGYESATLRERDGLLQDPRSVESAAMRAVRGGSVALDAKQTRSAARAARDASTRDPFVGLRAVRAVAR